MNIYTWLFIICVCVSGSGYIGFIAGINTKRNVSYRKGYERGKLRGQQLVSGLVDSILSARDGVGSGR